MPARCGFGGPAIPPLSTGGQNIAADPGRSGTQLGMSFTLSLPAFPGRLRAAIDGVLLPPYGRTQPAALGLHTWPARAGGPGPSPRDTHMGWGHHAVTLGGGSQAQLRRRGSVGVPLLLQLPGDTWPGSTKWGWRQSGARVVPPLHEG